MSRGLDTSFMDSGYELQFEVGPIRYYTLESDRWGEPLLYLAALSDHTANAVNWPVKEFDRDFEGSVEHFYARLKENAFDPDVIERHDIDLALRRHRMRRRRAQMYQKMLKDFRQRCIPS